MGMPINARIVKNLSPGNGKPGSAKSWERKDGKSIEGKSFEGIAIVKGQTQKALMQHTDKLSESCEKLTRTSSKSGFVASATRWG